MIARLCGTIVTKTPTYVEIDVHGVVYEVFISLNCYHALLAAGDTAEIFTSFLVRQDSMTLYGFSTREEKHLFCLLITVNNIGPKLALSVLNEMTPALFREALLCGDVQAFTRIHGVGQKTAQRIMMELKDKIIAKGTRTKKMDGDISEDISVGLFSDTRFQDALNALLALGYRQNDAERVVHDMYRKGNHEALTVEHIVRDSLKVIR